jgi:hypothetical protein
MKTIEDLLIQIENVTFERVIITPLNIVISIY